MLGNRKVRICFKFLIAKVLVREQKLLFECLERDELVGHAKTRRYTAATFLCLLRIIIYF